MFRYLNQSSCFQLDAKATDAHDFQLTKQAMAVMGMTKEEMVRGAEIVEGC